MNENQDVQFYHRLRLIFTYYASQGFKQDPLVLREKNFHKFLLDSTISQLVKIQNKKFISNQRKSKIETKSKQLQVIIDTFSRPIHYKQFLKIITNLIFQIRHQKNWEDVFQDIEIQKNLFNMCQQDKIVSEIFFYLYEQIQQGTQFGNLILFSQNKQFFNQKNFIQMEQHKILLRKIYAHYFTQILRKQKNSIQDIMAVLKKFSYQFQVSPFKITLTQIFVLIWQINLSKIKSVYEKNFENSSFIKDRSIIHEEWAQFDFSQFVKFLILMSNLLVFKQKTITNNQQKNQIIKNFLQSLSTSKGFKNIKSIYKINQTFFINDKIKTNNLKISQNTQKLDAISNKQTLKFEFKNIQNLKGLRIVKIFNELLKMIFESYVSNNKYGLMGQKSFEYFCSQFKIVPNIVSRRQMGQIYMRIFFERDPIIQNKELYKKIRQRYMNCYRRQNMDCVINNLRSKICVKFTQNERLIYLIEHIYNKQKIKVLMQRLRSRQNYNVEKDINIENMFKGQNGNDQVSNKVYNEHESMYKKLRNSLK